MFVRNFLTAGDYVTVMPVGLPITLQYDANGVLEKIYRGYDNSTIDVTSSVKDAFIRNKKVPRTISVKTSTTWVTGVLFTSKLLGDPKCIGEVPFGFCDAYIADFVQDPNRYNFFAGCVRSLSTVFRGAVPIRQFLKLSGFELLPGYVVPADLNEEKFKNLVKSSKFSYPLFSDYIVFKRADVQYYNLGFHQILVTRVSQSMSDSGDILCTIYGDPSTKFTVDYSDVVRWNIRASCVLMLDESGQIIHSKDSRSRKSVQEETAGRFKCPVCGKLYAVPKMGPTHCADDHCNSRLYPVVVHMLSVLGFGSITKAQYDEVVKHSGAVFSVVDVIDELFSDKKIQGSPSKILRAVVPDNIVSGFDGFDTFCNRCNNRVESISYYLRNPDKANHDLKLYESSVNYTSFLTWLSDPINCEDVISLFNHPNVELSQSGLAMPKVAPIFRGTTILITGKFRHGSDEGICSILSSYGAHVVTRYSKDVNIVVTGDTQEGINGMQIRAASENSVPIYTESTFFKKFEIDHDMEENL